MNPYERHDEVEVEIEVHRGRPVRFRVPVSWTDGYLDEFSEDAVYAGDGKEDIHAFLSEDARDELMRLVQEQLRERHGRRTA